MRLQRASLVALNRNGASGDTTKPAMQHSKMLQYIAMFYNNHRLHSYLEYKSPNQYEAQAEKMKNVA